MMSARLVVRSSWAKSAMQSISNIEPICAIQDNPRRQERKKGERDPA